MDENPKLKKKNLNMYYLVLPALRLDSVPCPELNLTKPNLTSSAAMWVVTRPYCTEEFKSV